uniref:Transmembrane protein n=1 Tax=Panagrolaimus superbus TaxID=310955 RepID=A0A914Y3W2_9BILA
MKIEFLVLLFVVTTLKKIVGQSEYDIVKTPCSTNGTLLNYNIYSDNIAQFFSPNYPKNLIINETTSFCQARFYTIVQNYRIWMALYNGYTQSYNVFDDNNHQFGRDYFDSNDAIASFSSKTESLTYELDTFTNASYDWTAFQGVVIAYGNFYLFLLILIKKALKIW